MRVDNKQPATIVAEAPVAPVKRGRGRPRKNPLPTVQKIIHNIFVLDRSGSMQMQGRIGAAVEGLLENFASIRADTSGAKNITSLLSFHSSGLETWDLTEATKLPTVLSKSAPGNRTALNDAIYVAGETAKTVKADATLISIFTDGGENGSVFSNKQAANYIKELQEKFGFTVTFIGTQYDVHTMVRNYNVDVTNTVSHDNTAAGISSAMSLTSQSRSAYSKAVVAGEDTLTGFYTKKLTNE